MRRVWLVFLLVVSASFASVAVAANRVAFVVGNSAYQHATHLPNPGNDAQDMSALLQSLGFKVIGGIDLDRRGFIEKLAEFGRSVSNADVALFFYAGHGLQVHGENYLVPVDAQIEFEEEIDLFLIPLRDVMRQMDRDPARRGNRAKIVMLDACRDNPFPSGLKGNADRSAVAIGKGLGKVRTERGTFIAFATEPDAVAADGVGRNSPFTTALLTHMPASGQSISDMMIKVRNQVLDETQNRQTPWDSSSLVENVYLAGAPGGAAAVVVAPPTEPAPRQSLTAGDEAAYNAAVGVNTCKGYEAFIRRFPESLYAELAAERKAAVCAAASAGNQSFEVAGLPPAQNNGAATRKLSPTVIGTDGRKVNIRAIPGDDRDIGWVYINNCGVPAASAQRLRKAIDDMRFRNLRLIPGRNQNFSDDQPECQAGTTVKVYMNSARGAVGGAADRATNELLGLLQSRSVDAVVERETDVGTIDDLYRIDIWLVP